ncbi:MAG TPA: hypothetical protein VJ249_01550 [Candidatus Bathyarchaeia archaeon]|nr:hypothetical protein [Candidatus Bathyarchaeia archaeon]
MRLVRSIHGLSKIILILLLLISFIVGALFSYVYTMGYYAPSEFRIPEKPVITIQSVEFSEQNTRFFDVTLLNPSYSLSDVNITRIEARTTDDNRVHVITEAIPGIPFILRKGHSQTFRATWNWANYTGIRLPYTDRPVEIRIFSQDGRGEIFELKRPLTILIITDLEFNPGISVNHFNVTVQNLESSQTYVNVSAFSLEGNVVPTDKVTPNLPYALSPGDSPVKFQCFYNWTALMNQSITVGVSTLQGYIALRTRTLPEPVILDIPQVILNATTSTEQFNVTVTNAAASSTYVDINRITIAVNQQAPINITQWMPDPSSRLDKNSTVLIVCNWNWSSYAGQSATVKVTIYTSQGFIVSKETQIP